MDITLIAADLRRLQSMPDDLARGLGLGFDDPAAGRAAVAEVLETLEGRPRPPPWGSYWARDAEARALVGLCGFKGVPGPAGEVEIAYYTFPGLEGRGVATAMAAALVAIARDHGAAAVIAHTLPVANASGAILAKLGFSWRGEAQDPEDGLVWRWRLETSPP